MAGIVALPMYAVPEDALAVFWEGLRRHLHEAGLRDVPAGLTRPDCLSAHWLEPDLLLSQTCGYPFSRGLAGKVRYVGTPCYGAEGCAGASSCSVVVVRADDPAGTIVDLRGRRVAFNEPGSQSGTNALRALLAPLARDGRFFAAAIASGTHRRSAAMVRDGVADVAAIDCVTFALLRRDQPDAVGGLRVLCRTASAPGLPFITALGSSEADLARLRSAIRHAVGDPALAEARAAMLLTGFEVLPPGSYAVCRAMAETAAARGYPDLA